MLSTLQMSPADPILALIAEFRADPRPGKMDFGVGVYKDAAGNTPVLRAVKAAEARKLERQESKSYLGLLGDAGFSRAVSDLALGGVVAEDRMARLQTPGGSGALWLLISLAQRADPDLTVWVSKPTWGNHGAIVNALGAPLREYAYYDQATGGVAFEQMRDDLADAGPHDLVIFHGCCHNPTGANLTAEHWAELAEMAASQGFVPLIDLAYQGFGDGLEADAAGLRTVAAAAPEALVAISCSKNFGLYRDRVGCAIAIAETPAARDATEANLMTLMRTTISMPPDHGAALVRMILGDGDLRAMWEAELTEMRGRMRSLRRSLAEELRTRANSDRFDFLAAHRGMFSLTGATPEQAAALKADHAVYIVGDGRMNIAGLTEERMPEVAAAFLAVGL